MSSGLDSLENPRDLSPIIRGKMLLTRYKILKM